MKYKKITAWVLFAFWLILIFYFSNQPGSVSSDLSNNVLKTILNNLAVSNFNVLAGILRKLAHFTEYFILSILTLNLLKQYYEIEAREFMLVMLFCFFYACTDEFHQLFILNRGSSFLDVLLDYTGSLLYLTLNGFIRNFKRDKID